MPLSRFILVQDLLTFNICYTLQLSPLILSVEYFIVEVTHLFKQGCAVGAAKSDLSSLFLMLAP